MAQTTETCRPGDPGPECEVDPTALSHTIPASDAPRANLVGSGIVVGKPARNSETCVPIAKTPDVPKLKSNAPTAESPYLGPPRAFPGPREGGITSRPGEGVLSTP